MTPDEFRSTLRNDDPQPDLPPLLQALWWDTKGDWNRAHQIAQEIESRDAAWIHAYLHRKAGDASNAGYWYGQAGKPYCRMETDAEWLDIIHHLLGV